MFFRHFYKVLWFFFVSLFDNNSQQKWGLLINEGIPEFFPQGVYYSLKKGGRERERRGGGGGGGGAGFIRKRAP